MATQLKGPLLTQRTGSAETATQHYLRRIEEDDEKIGAFIYVDAERARATARALDALRAAGTVLGPLHGAVVALKDHLFVDGMPTVAGSEIPIGDLIGTEGPFVRALRAAGCVIIGKTRATEFAAGAYNLDRRTPWNPCDPEIPRMTGGSSNGSAAAVAAGFCDFAIGSDTGGSVRLPAALCGLFGYRPTPGVWSIEGVFPLVPSLDTLGPLTRSVHDAITIFETLTPQRVPDVRLDRLRFGRPTKVFYDDLDADVSRCMDAALARLRQAGVQIDPVETPDLDLVLPVFDKMLPSELIATLGRDRVEKHAGKLDGMLRKRLTGGFEITGIDYVAMARRKDALAADAAQRMRGFDAWVTPTTPTIPTPLSEVRTVDSAIAWNRRSLRNTRPGNIFAQCGVSIPIQHLGSRLPVGLQLFGANGDDARLLGLARAVDEALA